MIFAPRDLDQGIAALAGEPVFAAILERAGAPRFRRRVNGFPTLLHIILEQQVSIDAAASMHRRLSETLRPLDAGAVSRARRRDLEALRLQPAENLLCARPRRFGRERKS